MKRNMKAYTVAYRRKRTGKTDYRLRLKLLSSDRIRVVVRKGLNNFNVQVVKFDPKGDSVITSVHSTELSKYGWNAHRGNTSAAYLTGYLCGLKAVKIKVNDCILDLGIAKAITKSNLFAVVKGLKDAGIKVPCSDDVLPSDEMVSGKNIADYAKHLENDKEKYSKQFSAYVKKGLRPQEITKYFNDVKNKIKEKWQ